MPGMGVGGFMVGEPHRNLSFTEVPLMVRSGGWPFSSAEHHNRHPDHWFFVSRSPSKRYPALLQLDLIASASSGTWLKYSALVYRLPARPSAISCTTLSFHTQKSTAMLSSVVA